MLRNNLQHGNSNRPKKKNIMQYFDDVERTATGLAMAFREQVDWCTHRAPTEPPARPYRQDLYRVRYAVPGQHYYFAKKKNNKAKNTAAGSQKQPSLQEATQPKSSVSQVRKDQKEWVSYDFNADYLPPNWNLDFYFKPADENLEQNLNSQIHSTAGRTRVRNVEQSYPNEFSNGNNNTLHRSRATGLSVVRFPHDPPAANTISPQAVKAGLLILRPQHEPPAANTIPLPSVIFEEKLDPPEVTIMPEEECEIASLSASTETSLGSLSTERQHCDSEDATPRNGVEQADSCLSNPWNRDSSVAPHLQAVSCNVLCRCGAGHHSNQKAAPDPPVPSVGAEEDECSRQSSQVLDESANDFAEEKRMQPDHEASSSKVPIQSDDHRIAEASSSVGAPRTKLLEIDDYHGPHAPEIWIRPPRNCFTALELGSFGSRILNYSILEDDTIVDSLQTELTTGSASEIMTGIGSKAPAPRQDAPLKETSNDLSHIYQDPPGSYTLNESLCRENNISIELAVDRIGLDQTVTPGTTPPDVKALEENSDVETGQDNETEIEVVTAQLIDERALEVMYLLRQMKNGFDPTAIAKQEEYRQGKKQRKKWNLWKKQGKPSHRRRFVE